MNAKVKGLVLGLGVAAVFALCVYGNNPVTAAGGSFTDLRDNQTYRTVRIGNLTWMAENLNFAGSGGNTVGVCYDNDPSNCALYGRLYNWPAAMNIDQSYLSTWWGGHDSTFHQGICPDDWRVPNELDWNALVTAAGGSSIAGTKLKSQTGWEPWSGVPFGTDDFGFSALPGGRGWSGDFGYVGLVGYWWSASEGGADSARGRFMYCDGEGVGSNWNDKYHEFSVRCVMD